MFNNLLSLGFSPQKKKKKKPVPVLVPAGNLVNETGSALGLAATNTSGYLRMMASFFLGDAMDAYDLRFAGSPPSH